MNGRAPLALMITMVQITVQFHLKGHSLRPEDGVKTFYQTPVSEFLDPGQDTEIVVVGLEEYRRTRDFKATSDIILKESPELVIENAVENSPEEVLESGMTALPKNQNEAIIENELKTSQVGTRSMATPVVVVEELIDSGGRLAEPIGSSLIMKYFFTDMDVERTGMRNLELIGSNDNNMQRRRRDVSFVDSQLQEFAARRFRPGKMRI